MTTYTKATNFATKDALLTGNPSKVVKGTEIDAEFTAIQAADADNAKTSALSASSGSSLVAHIDDLSGAVATTVQEKLRDLPKSIQADFDATGNGSTDDTAAVQAAFDALGSTGGKLDLPPGDYKITSTLTIGDGTTTTISTKCGMVISGHAGGVSEGEFGAPRYGVRIIWAGALGGTMVKVNGPIHNVKISGILFDGADLANICLELIHPYASTFTNVACVRYRTKGIYLRTISAALFSGITQGAMDNSFSQIIASDPTLDTAVGLHASGYETNNVGCSRNTFKSCKFAIGGNAADSAGIVLEYADNNTFIECFTFRGTASTSGKGVYFVAASNTLFPHENAFINCPLIDGVGGTPGTGGNVFFPYPTSDGEAVPDATKHVFLTHTGLLGGINNLYLGNGSAASPALTFNSDQDIGWYRVGANSLGMSLNGTLTAEYSTSLFNFTVPRQRITDNSPTYELYESDAAANEKSWRISSSAGKIQFETWTDAGLFGSTALDIDRSGTTVDRFTSYAPFRVSGADAVYEWYESDAAANEKLWKIEATGGNWQLETWTDAGLFGANAVQVIRTGTTVDEIGLYATTIKFGTATASVATPSTHKVAFKTADGSTYYLLVTI